MGTDDKRHHARRAIERTAHIATGLGPPLECQMSDVSQSGVRIAVAQPDLAPQEFLLLFSNDLSRWCRVIWRSDHEIGTTFIDPPASLTEPRRDV